MKSAARLYMTDTAPSHKQYVSNYQIGVWQFLLTEFSFAKLSSPPLVHAAAKELLLFRVWDTKMIFWGLLSNKIIPRYKAIEKLRVEPRKIKCSGQETIVSASCRCHIPSLLSCTNTENYLGQACKKPGTWDPDSQTTWHLAEGL